MVTILFTLFRVLTTLLITTHLTSRKSNRGMQRAQGIELTLLGLDRAPRNTPIPLHKGMFLKPDKEPYSILGNIP